MESKFSDYFLFSQTDLLNEILQHLVKIPEMKDPIDKLFNLKISKSVTCIQCSNMKT